MRLSLRNIVAGGVALLLSATLARAQSTMAKRGRVVTDTMWAQSLGITKSVSVYLPPSYATERSRRYPVLIYLHGLGGNERNWVDTGHLDRTLDSLIAAGKPEAIVVMPDGDDGWYTTWNALPDVPGCRADTTRKESPDTFCVPWPHYDDYIASDVVAFVDKRYRTIADGKHRGIAGLSMGGYGAISLALAYPGVFAAVASHSGVLSPRYLGPKPYAQPVQYASNLKEFEAATSRGLWPSMRAAFGRDTIAWGSRDPRQLAARRQAKTGTGWPKILIDCGTDDAFISQNRDFHQTLLTLGVSHQYAEWPGGHTWAYWTAHAAQSLDFLLATVNPHS